MEQLWAAEENWLKDYVSWRRNLGDHDFVLDDKEAALGNYQESEIPTILKVEGDLAEITIKGGLSNRPPNYFEKKYGYLRSSYPEIIKATKIISENSSIKRVNLLIDSPGGTWRGLDAAWQALYSLRKGRKITAINQGLMASAAYYLGSVAHKIHSTSAANEVGSIGVVMVVTDWSKYDAKIGIKEIVILSSNAPDKWPDVTKKEGLAKLQDSVNQAEAFFMDRIKIGRKLELNYIKENFGRGGVLYSQSPPDTNVVDALSVKMIDKVISGNSLSSQKSGMSLNKSENAESVSTTDKNEELSMSKNLEELLAENPWAKSEYDAALKEGRETALKDGREETKAVASKAIKLVRGKSYPDPIVLKALEVAAGEASIETLDSVVTMYDMSEEGKKSAEARAESAQTPETPSQEINLSDDNVARTPDDFLALNARIRKLKGLPGEEKKDER